MEDGCGEPEADEDVRGAKKGGALVMLEVRELGEMEYGAALAVQRATVEEVVGRREQGRAGCEGWAGVVLMVEHVPAVITVSRRPGARAHLIASEAELRRAGVAVEETDRGGDITYHGPGQLVVYPVVDLNKLGLRLHGYMRMLEEVVIRSIRRFGIEGVRDERATGVWVAGEDGGAKICAIGVRVSRWVTMHGFALNVRTKLEDFGFIVPCGLAGRGVTSMARELGEARCPSMAEVKHAVAEEFSAAVGEAG